MAALRQRAGTLLTMVCLLLDLGTNLGAEERRDRGMRRDCPREGEGILVTSPRPRQILPEGQDLVVRLSHPPCRGARGGRGQSRKGSGACRTLVLINGTVVARTEDAPAGTRGCWRSLLVRNDLLKPGLNDMLVMVLDAGGSDEGGREEEEGEEGEEEEESLLGESSIQFRVESRSSWVPEDRDECKHEPTTGDGSCIHEVDGKCIVRDRPPVAGSSIPRILHWVWVGGGGSIPEKFHAYMQSWRERHADWQFIVWTDELVTWELRNEALMYQADSYAELSDIVRLEVVERFGGVYVDTDFESLQAMDEHLAGLDFFVGIEKDADTQVGDQENNLGSEWVCPSLFGSAPHHPVLRSIIEGLPGQVAENVGADPNHKTGPYYWTEILKGARACEENYGDQDCPLPPPSVSPVGDYGTHASAVLHKYLVREGTARIFEPGMLYPYGWWELERARETFPGAIAVHHWQKNWGGGW